MNPIDLHVHSTRSDGTLTPTELVHHARQLGLSAFALTDHDTTAGLEEAVHEGLRDGIDVVPGIEFSTEYEGRDVHVLGYSFDYETAGFQQRIHEFVDARDLRNRKMCEKLCAAGIPVPYEDLMADYPDSVVTRAQFATYMMRHGIVKTRDEAFSEYIGDDCPYFVPRAKITPEKAVQFLLEYHGVPVLAHPYQYGLGDAGLEQLIVRLKKAGLMGLECVYARYSEAQVRALEALAAKYDLLVTGGSDFHGENKPGLEMGTGYNGNLYVPETLLTKLRQRLYHTTDHTKAFFADLDGTLLNSEKRISPKTRETLTRWCGSGNLLILSSGRALYDCLEVYEELDLHDLPGVYIEAYNGAQLYDCSTGQTIFREGIPREMLNKIFDDCREHGVYVHTYTDDGIAVRLYRKETKFYQRYHHMQVREAGVAPDSDFIPDKEDLEAREEYYCGSGVPMKGASGSLQFRNGWTGLLGIPYRYYPDYRCNPAGGDITKLLSMNPCKCIAIELTDPERIAGLQKFLNEKYAGKLESFMSNTWYLEIVSCFSGKGRGLKRFCRRFGISVANSLAAGDSGNDISMIRAAGTGIAMCNGVLEMPQLLEAANVVTDADNDHDGLAPILESAMKQQGT